MPVIAREISRDTCTRVRQRLPDAVRERADAEDHRVLRWLWFVFCAPLFYASVPQFRFQRNAKPHLDFGAPVC